MSTFHTPYNLPVQCVGPWVEDKYYFLERYLNATSEVRRKFYDRGNAVFIDLFAGPGKCIIRNTKKIIKSGGIRALDIDVPFNQYFYFDIDEENTKALEKRIDLKYNRDIECGDSNYLVKNLVKKLLAYPYKRYHFVYIDPYGPEGLKFDTFKELAQLDRIDMLIHFPIGAIKRNINIWKGKTKTILDECLGTDRWREAIKDASSSKIYGILITIFKEQLQSIGYPEDGLKMVSSNKNIYTGLPAISIKNTKEVTLYVLVLASKHSLAQKIWNSVIKIEPDGQRTFF